MTTINIRIDEDLKNKANKTLGKMGLDLSSAVKMFLHQTVKEDGLPFSPTNNKKFIREKWDKEVDRAITTGKRYTDTREMFDDILKGK
ncbi:MAG: type II toxin-antitoxin system RelB/DinJ family antitoxin [Candidatus Moranbacteria bacterium]|nr:type II toxin-antitoxin system RelB/DinJ family antitoxin [Candidatus Moranbacteria bacterium]